VSARACAPKAVRSGAAPAPIGPYSGQIGLDGRTGEVVAGGVREEARRALDNLGHVLREAGLGFGEVVKTTVYLVDLAEFTAVNEIYAGFVRPPYPARATVGVAALPRGARVEIEAIARRQ
jgi:2-iminobutanoate/2-iminopropanoate deaminase